LKKTENEVLMKTTKWALSRVLMGVVLVAGAMVPVPAGGAALEKTPAYQEQAMRLRAAAPQKFEFNRAVLRDALRFLAEAAGLNYINLPEDEGAAQSLVTFNMTASPFAALELIAENHGVALVYERSDDVWYMRPLNDHQLIARSYQIRFSTGEIVTPAGGSSAGLGGGALGAPAGGGGGGGSGSDQGGLGSGGMGGGGLSLNNYANAFVTTSDGLVQKVEQLLGIGTSGVEANVAPQTTPGYGGNLQLQVPPRSAGGPAPGADGGPQPQVVWTSDTNSLFVVASRQQHQIVDAFLESIDRPQPLVAIEVKFFETGQDPRKRFGIDWTGVLNEYQLDATGLEAPELDLNDIAGTALWPQSVILSANDASVTLSAIMSDSETRTTSYPRVVTQHNREVSIQSVVNEPVLSTESSTSVAAGGVQTANVTYLPIGTTVRVLPKIMPDGNVHMSLGVTVSSIIGEVIINGNPYPKASSRVYTAPLQLKSGYTAAIAGLDEADDNTSEVGVPFFGRLPGVGALFRDRSKSRTRKNLMIWITPYVLRTDSEGLGETPVAELPITQSDPLRSAPKIFGNGELYGGIDALDDAVLWADREQRRISTAVEERRIDDQMTEDACNLMSVCESLSNWIAVITPRYPTLEQELSVHRWSLDQILRKTQRENWNAFVADELY
jgi:hypothetical protein